MEQLFARIRQQNSIIGRLDGWFITPTDIKTFISNFPFDPYTYTLERWMSKSNINDEQCISLEEFIYYMKSI